MARDFEEKEEKEEGYELVLTSETIYSEDSVDDLLAVLKAANAGQAKHGKQTKKGENTLDRVEVGLEESLGDLGLGNWRKGSLREQDGVVLVAAKVSLHPCRP